MSESGSRATTHKPRRTNPIARPRMLVAGAIAVALIATGCAGGGADLAALLPTQGAPGPGTALTTSAGCASAGNPAPVTGLLVDVGGGIRGSMIAVPADYDRSRHYPLLVSLHPFSMEPGDWETYSGLAAAAVQRGYIVVTPRGSDPGPRWSVPGGLKLESDDFAFIDALVDQVTATWCIDITRVFAAGYSAGAAMAMALSCERPMRFAAIAASGGANLTRLCPFTALPGRVGTDSLVIHGTSDPIAPLGGSYVVFAPPLGLELGRVVANSAERNGCSPTPTTVPLTPSVSIDRYTGCTGGRLEYWPMAGFGHTWAGTTNFFDFLLGGTDQSFSATEAVLDFFDAD